MRAGKIALFAMALILISATAYGILFASGPTHLGDDLWYSYLAHSVASGSFKQSVYDIFSVRILHVIPIGIIYKFFGYSPLSGSAWDTICFLMSILLTFLIGRELCNEYVGVIAALLISFLPMSNILAVTMSDNLPMMFFASLAMFTMIRALKSRSTKWYIAAGASLVLAPLTTPEGYIVWIIALFFACIELLRGRMRVSGAINLALGFSTLILVLMLFNYIEAANPLVTFQAVSAFYSNPGQSGHIPYVYTNLTFYLRVMFPYHILSVLSSNLGRLSFNPLSIWQQAYNSQALSGLYFYAFVISIAYLAAKRDWEISFAAWWFIIGLLYLEFGPEHIGFNPFTYGLSHRLDRFLLIIAVPMCIVIAAALVRFANRSGERWIWAKAAVAFFALLLIIATAIPITLYWHGVVSSEAYSQSSIAHYLSQYPNTTKIYFDWNYADLFSYMNFENVSRFILYPQANNYSCADIPSGSFVIIPTYAASSLIPAPAPSQCANWVLVLDPQSSENRASAAYINSSGFQTDLYYVSNNFGSISKNSSYSCGYDIYGYNKTYSISDSCSPARLFFLKGALNNRIGCGAGASISGVVFQDGTYNNTIMNCTFANAVISSMHNAQNNIISPYGKYLFDFADSTSNIALGYYLTFLPKDINGVLSEERFAAVAPYRLVAASPDFQVFNNQFLTWGFIGQFAGSINYTMPRFGENLPVNSSQRISFPLESEQISLSGTKNFNPYWFTVPFWGFDILSYREFNITSNENYTPMFIKPNIKEDAQLPDNTVVFWNFTVINYSGARNITARVFNGYQFEPPKLVYTINNLRGNVSYSVGRQSPGIYAFIGELQSSHNGVYEQSNSTSITYGIGLAFCTQTKQYDLMPISIPGYYSMAFNSLNALDIFFHTNQTCRDALKVESSNVTINCRGGIINSTAVSVQVINSTNVTLENCRIFGNATRLLNSQLSIVNSTLYANNPSDFAFSGSHNNIRLVDTKISGYLNYSRLSNSSLSGATIIALNSSS